MASRMNVKIDTSRIAGQMLESLDKGKMSSFLFEEDTGGPPPESDLDPKAKLSKQKVIKYVADVAKALGDNEMPETANLMKIAQRTLVGEFADQGESSIVLFTLAPAAGEGIRNIMLAIKTFAEANEITNAGSRVYQKVPGDRVFDDLADIKKIIEGAFKSNPSFYKSLLKSLPGVSTVIDFKKSFKTTESAAADGSLVMEHDDPFDHLPPLFEEIEKKEALTEIEAKSAAKGAAIGYGAIKGALAGSALAGPVGFLGGAVVGGLASAYGIKAAKNMGDYITTLRKGGTVTGKGSVASYMALFKNKPIHTALLNDLKGVVKLSNAIKIAEAIEKATVTHLQVKPPKLRADIIAGIDDVSPEDSQLDAGKELNDSGVDSGEYPKIVDYLRDNLRVTWDSDTANYIPAWTKGSSVSEYFDVESSAPVSDRRSINAGLLKFAEKIAQKMAPKFEMTKEAIVDTLRSIEGPDLEKLRSQVPSAQRRALVALYEEILKGLRLKWENEEYRLIIPDSAVKAKFEELQGPKKQILIKYLIKPKKVKDPSDVVRTLEEGLNSSEGVIIERWQRLAGIIK